MLRLLDILDNKAMNEDDPTFTYIYRLLEIVSPYVEQDQLPLNTIEILLRAAIVNGIGSEDAISLGDIAISYINVDRFQRHIIASDEWILALQYLISSYSPDIEFLDFSIPAPEEILVLPTVNDESELISSRKAMVEALSDLSVLPDFQQKYAYNSNVEEVTALAKSSTALTSRTSSSQGRIVLESLKQLLSAKQVPQVQLCSCILLGNLARSDTMGQYMLSHLNIQQDLLEIVRSSSDDQVLHSTLAFLRNLAIPSQNKEVLQDSGILESLSRFWGASATIKPQMTYSAAMVARQVINGCIANVRRLLRPLSTDHSSPAHSKTYLSLILASFTLIDDIAVKTEVGRIVAAVLRAVVSTQDAALADLLFTLHGDLATPLGVMVTQNQYPVIRSEGWFAMALMARSAAGAELLHVLLSDAAVFGALGATISGSTSTIQTKDSTPELSSEPSPDQQAKDRQNALVLVNEMLKHGVRLQIPFV